MKNSLAVNIKDHIIVSRYLNPNEKLTVKVISKPSYRYRKITKDMLAEPVNKPRRGAESTIRKLPLPKERE